MKAILEFDLDEIDDRRAHLRAVKSLDMALVIWELLRNSRKELEWTIENETEGDYAQKEIGLSMVYDKFEELLEHYGINIDELC